MQNGTLSKTNRMVGTAILIALIIILQTFASFVKFGSFSITLALVPIVVGAAMYGAAAGAVLGGVFGAVVLLFCINGVDPGGNMLWAANPLLTALLCLVKGAAAGFVAGIVYSAMAKINKYIGVVCAAIVSPIINTGIFLAAMFFLYRNTLTAWAGDTEVLSYLFIGLAGVNFLLEFGVNIVLSPGIVRIINAAKKVS